VALRLARIGALLNMSNSSLPPQWTEIDNTARTVGIASQLFDVRKAADLAPAFETASRQQIGAFVVGIDALTQENQKLIIELAAKHRLPAIYPSRSFFPAPRDVHDFELTALDTLQHGLAGDAIGVLRR
jgi:putative ABC transport system substrate-binding protein